MTPILTVIIAAKDPPRDLLSRCLSSFAALPCARKLQVVIVLSGKLPSVDQSTVSVFNAFEVVETAAEGVYVAYNTGIDLARGRYLLFFGVDDIALPPLESTVSSIEENEVDLFAAPCYMEKQGLRRPSMNRYSLIHENWCQQGLIYARTAVSSRRFDVRYPIQADHKLNIDLVTDPATRLAIGSEPIAFFSSGGLSSHRHDIAFIRDFPAIIRAHYGPLIGMLYGIRRRISVWVHGPIERRYCNPES
jgi:hypothetical protein